MRNSSYAGLALNVFGYNNPKPLARLKQRLDEIYFSGSYQPHQWFLTLNGRTAIYLFLKSLNLPVDSEVIVQSFTCVTAVNPILWAGLTPVYTDIDPNTFSAASGSLESLITSRTKVIMLQHTFGAPAASKMVLEVARKHDLIILEDCAHALGGQSDGQMLGTFGDAAIISFGIEKTLSTKLGGALLINNSSLVQPVEKLYRQLTSLPRYQTFLWMIYPPLRSLVRKLPTAIEPTIKNIIEAVGLLKRAVPKAELAGKVSSTATLPGVQARVVLEGLSRLEANLSHRQDISRLYRQLLKSPLSTPNTANINPAPLIKFPVVCPSPQLRDQLFRSLTAKGIYVTRWYDPPLYPTGVSYDALSYNPADCPITHDLGRRILNLPTGPNITSAHATMIANELNACAAQFSSGNQSVSNPS